MPLNIDAQQILLHLFNFAILAAGLYFLLYKPVKQFMLKRMTVYGEREAAASKNETEAEKLRQKYEQMILDADEEIQRQKAEASEELEAEKRLQLDQARAEARKIISTASKTAEIRSQKVLQDAHEEVRTMAVEMVEKLVMESGGEALDAFLNAVERKQADNG